MALPRQPITRTSAAQALCSMLSGRLNGRILHADLDGSQQVARHQHKAAAAAATSSLHPMPCTGTLRAVSSAGPQRLHSPLSSRRIALISSKVLTSLAVSFQKLVGYPSLRPSTSTGSAWMLQALRISLNSITSATLRVMMPAVNSKLPRLEPYWYSRPAVCLLKPEHLEADAVILTY